MTSDGWYKPLVIVFARAPRYGSVKTRLARDIGAPETLRFYRNLLQRLLRHVGRDPRFETQLAVTPDQEGHMLASGKVRVIGQGRGDLGRRMIRALRSAEDRPCVIVGSDVPDLKTRHIAEAFRALGHAPFVLGPARDGGYWLIGARHPRQLRQSVLDGVRWSSAFTLSDTVGRLGDVHVIGTVLEDIDEGGAYRRFAGRAQPTSRRVATKRSTSRSS